MTADELRKKYLDFFAQKGHKIIPSAPLVPENDPTTLFTSSGMQPLIPYLLGQVHPEGKKLTDSQPSFRTQDIEEVGDNRHTTFFEMLGNWSLGSYFKKEQLPWIFEFMTDVVGLDPKKLYVTVFAGDDKFGLPKDTESVEIWNKLFKEKGIDARDIELGTVEKGSEDGMQGGRIFHYGVDKNLWSRFNGFEEIAIGEPFGPDSEIFYEFTEVEHDKKYGKNCHPNCDCGRFLEIGNSVFMEFKKLANNKFEILPNKNVDFGGGLERITAASINSSDVFRNDLFEIIIKAVEEHTNKKYSDPKNQPPMRVIADHMKAAVFLIVSGVVPSNKLQGYFLRRLLRRSAVKMYQLGGGLTPLPGLGAIAESVLITYDGVKETGIDRSKQRDLVEDVVIGEISKFGESMDKGLKQVEKIKTIDGKAAFDLYQTYGFPLEVTEELFLQKGQTINREEFKQEFEKHKELSRTASAGMFKGGLVDHSEIATQYHTATHLLHQSLRSILGESVKQEGSNITAERMRFDFSHTTKLTEEEIKKVEDLVNEKIKENLEVIREEMSKEEALKSGALGFFIEKYADMVSVYKIGDFSKEICGGPHVKFTGELKRFKIIKEESVGKSVRRIYATLG